jgi:aryl-alcohol dehydrogenase-like predicted oxidoreductase
MCPTGPRTAGLTCSPHHVGRVYYRRATVNYARLGRSGLRVSRLGLGTMNFGKRTAESDSFAIMDRAVEAGINFFDTADIYAGGRSEEIVGKWLVRSCHERERILLGTKVYRSDDQWPNKSGLSARHIREACEVSLRRLQTEYIDLYQMHHVDRNTPWDELWQAIDVLVTQGKVLYIGSSNFAAWDIAAANEVARQRHRVGLVSEQSVYNLFTRTIELEMLPACSEYGLGVLAWSPLSGGLLAGVLQGEARGRRNSDRVRSAIDKYREKIVSWESLCNEIGEPPANVALAWVLKNPAVTAPILGPRTVDQLVGALGSLTLRLEKDVINRLEALFPGPSRSLRPVH